MTLRMIDSAYNSQFEAGFDAYGAYGDGGVGDQPNIGFVTREYPKARHFSFAVHARDDADCLDVERFAAVPSDIPGWVARQRKRGIARPGVYASASLMEASCLPVLRAARIALASVRLLSAHYAGRHVCAPSTCRLLSVQADGTQWTDRTDNRTADESLLLPDFFGPPKPAPGPAPQWPAGLTLREGDSGAAVRVLQAALGDSGIRGVRGITVDGVFGQQTLTSLRNFQSAKGLAVDGIAGQATRAALGIR